METKKGYVQCLEKGSGNLKSYKYYMIGCRPFTSKKAVVEAINVGVRVFRQDKIMKTIEEFDYKSLSFEKNLCKKCGKNKNWDVSKHPTICKN